jgi:hypothetical protein
MSRNPVETARRGRHSIAARLGLAGSGLGLLAGLVQATVGSRIPDWTGAKLAPGGLGLLTIAVLAWTAVVPVLLLLLAAALTVPLMRAAPARSPAHL